MPGTNTLGINVLTLQSHILDCMQVKKKFPDELDTSDACEFRMWWDDINMNIASPEFDWMIAYCDDGESAALYRA